MERDANINSLIQCVEEICELSAQTSYKLIHKEVSRYEQRLRSAKKSFRTTEVFESYSLYPEVDFIKAIGDRCDDKLDELNTYCQNMEKLVFTGDIDMQYLKHSISELGLLHTESSRKLNGIKQEYIKITIDKLLKNP